MTNADIKKAAIELCTTEAQEEWVKDYGIHCFLDGARWRIENAWHPINEVPGYGKHILVRFRSGNFTSWFVSSDILLVFNRFKVVEWAYIADLLPDRKEAKQ